MSRIPEIPGTIAVVQLQPVCDMLERLGFDLARVLAQAGVSAELLRDPNARVAGSTEFVVWDAAEAVTRDPLIGLRIAETVDVGALGAFEYLLRNSPTLRAAAERADRFVRVIDDLTHISLFEEGEHAVLRQWREGGYAHPPRAVECTFLAIVRLSDEYLGGARPSEVRFAHRTPAEIAAFERSFGCPVRFDRPHDEIVFPRSLVDAPLRAGDPRLGNVLEEHLERVLATMPSEDLFVLRARGALLTALRNGSASLEGLAAALGVSPRTLRRRLDQHRTSYRALLDELRRELAYAAILHGDETFDSIASRLGFTEPSTFYRAFKRWSGTTPALFREHKRT